MKRTIKIRKSPVEGFKGTTKEGGQKDYAFNWSGAIKKHNTDMDDKSHLPSHKFKNTIKEAPRDEANIEAESGESVIGDFDGDGMLEHMKIAGDKHHSGGTPLSVPEGSFVFSDTKKLKLGGQILTEFGKSEKTKKSFTPAELARQYDLNKFKAILEDPKSDKIDKDTANISLTAIQKKLGKLAFIQEAVKGFPQGVPGIADELIQGGQEQQEMQRGGLVKAQAGGVSGRWKGYIRPHDGLYGDNHALLPYRWANTNEVQDYGYEERFGGMGAFVKGYKNPGVPRVPKIGPGKLVNGELDLPSQTRLPAGYYPTGNRPHDIGYVDHPQNGMASFVQSYMNPNYTDKPFLGHQENLVNEDGTLVGGTPTQRASATPQRRVAAPARRTSGAPAQSTAQGFVPWGGDKIENTANASKMTASEIERRARSIGYTGPKDNASLQKWIKEQAGDSWNEVAELHDKYGMPKAGTEVDGKWGYRWDTALNNLSKRKIPQQGVDLTPKPNVFRGPINPNRPAPPIAGQPGTPNNGLVTPDSEIPFVDGKPSDITPNMFDLMGLTHAITRPIDHLRPNLYRFNPETVNPSLIDNRAEIQQMQGTARQTGDVIQNTASGQVARANMVGSQSKLFDVINNSNARRDQYNTGVVNQTNQMNNSIRNQANLTNLGALSTYGDQVTNYRANLSKEKQMKFADVMMQGQNMTNNMMKLMAIQSQTPNYRVSPWSWMPTGQFVPGDVGSLYDGTGAQQGSGDLFEAIRQAKAANPDMSEDLIKSVILGNKKGYVQTDTEGTSPIPKNTRVRRPLNQ